MKKNIFLIAFLKTLFLNKKNWVEVFKGKLGDVAFAEILTNENAKALFNYISENISFLT